MVITKNEHAFYELDSLCNIKDGTEYLIVELKEPRKLSLRDNLNDRELLQAQRLMDEIKTTDGFISLRYIYSELKDVFDKKGEIDKMIDILHDLGWLHYDRDINRVFFNNAEPGADKEHAGQSKMEF